MTVAVYIPVYNNVAWCRRLELLPGLRYVASDNGSTDGSAQALADRGVEVIVQERNLGRVGNWAFCVRHFAGSDAAWLKWLFAGDVLDRGFPEAAARAAQAYPDAGLVIGDNIHVDGTIRAHYRPLERPAVLEPREALEKLAAEGNWFYSPINQMVRREAVAAGFDFGPFDWAADVFFCMNLASRMPVAYCGEIFGEFHAAERRHFATQRESLRALLETSLVREMAAARLAAMDGDAERHARLSRAIEDHLLRRLSARRLRRTPGGALALAGMRGLRSAMRAGRGR